jgi:hypothetical protein
MLCSMFIYSSIWWNELVCKVAQKSLGKLGSSFYFVAIDCPGYGRSEGDKQIIRSYPTKFIGEVIQAITGGATKSAFCLVGSSQGAASVFNATHENPSICKFMTVMDPVCHAPHRFSNIKQPSLLIYDTEDTGHPVSVGRIVKSVMPNTMYFEFTKSVEPNWISRNMADKMIELFSENGGVSISDKIPDCSERYITHYGLVMSWVTAVDREWASELDLLELQNITLESEKVEARAGVDDMFCVEEESKVEVSFVDISPEEQERRLADKKCSICHEEDGEALFRIPDCCHGLCQKCTSHTVAFNRACPCPGCQGSIPEHACCPRPPKKLTNNGLLIQFGNKAVKSGEKITSTAFIEASSSVMSQINYCTFNINPEFPKSAVKVDKIPFELSRSMLRGFPCDMTIYWKPTFNRPPLCISYYMEVDKPLTKRNLFLILEKEEAAVKGKKKAIDYVWSGRDESLPTLSTVKMY